MAFPQNDASLGDPWDYSEVAIRDLLIKWTDL